jgi:hypothetical protein
MNKKLVGFLGVFVVVAVVVLVAWIVNMASGHSDAATNAMHVTANGFPVPPGATVAFPDNTVKKPPSVTKGWTATDNIDTACTTWRDAYRTWIGTQNLGSVTGNYTQGQECDYSGLKDGHRVTLQLAVYGNNPQPQATLTVTG